MATIETPYHVEQARKKQLEQQFQHINAELMQNQRERREVKRLLSEAEDAAEFNRFELRRLEAINQMLWHRLRLLGEEA